MTSWKWLKQTIDQKQVYPQYTEDDDNYKIKLYDGQAFIDECLINKTLEADYKEDFETNYKSKCNKPLIQQNVTFAAKVLANGNRIFRRVRGTSGNVQNTPDNIDFVIPFANCKITGLQILNGRLGDKATFQILDNAAGTISGTPNALLNTFAQDVYITPDVAIYPSKYDADLIQGLVLRIIYDAVDGELLPRTIYVNYDLHEVVA